MRKSLLIIENTKALNYVLTTVLKKEYHVYTVRSYADAFYFLRYKPEIDLFLIDIPDDKSENHLFLAHISSSSLFNRIPVIVLSDSDDSRLADKTKSLGASHFISMPFDPVSLSEKIKELITEKEYKYMFMAGSRTRYFEKNGQHFQSRNYEYLKNNLKLS